MSALPLEPPQDAVIDVRDLGVRVNDTDLVADVSFSIGRGERVGLIGESGSGKSLTGLSLMGLLLHAAMAGLRRLLVAWHPSANAGRPPL